MHSIKWGFQSSPHHVSYGELVQLWQRADALGFDTGWLFDHFFPIDGDPTGTCFEGYTMLTALAMQTSRLHVGLLVTSAIYRNPAVLAKIGATLDVVTAGRLEMGLGAGWFEGEAKAYGIPFPSTGDRLAQLDETSQILRALWTQESVNFTGKHFTLTDARCNPPPVQKPTPPIWIGGQGEKVTLRIVAEHADGWDMDMAPIEEYKRKLGILAEHCKRAGRDPETVKKMIHFSAIIAESESEVSQRATQLSEQWGKSVEAIRGEVLIGTPKQAAAQLQQYVDVGTTHFVLSLQAPYDMRMLELYINEVAPLVK